MNNGRPLKGAEYEFVCVCVCVCERDHQICILKRSFWLHYGTVEGGPRVEAESGWEVTAVVQMRDWWRLGQEGKW